MRLAKVSSRGQITLPADIRRKLGIEHESRVELTVSDSAIIVRPLKAIEQLDGILHKYLVGRERLSWDEERRRMEQAVARDANDG